MTFCKCKSQRLLPSRPTARSAWINEWKMALTLTNPFSVEWHAQINQFYKNHTFSGSWAKRRVASELRNLLNQSTSLFQLRDVGERCLNQSSSISTSNFEASSLLNWGRCSEVNKFSQLLFVNRTSHWRPEPVAALENVNDIVSFFVTKFIDCTKNIADIENWLLACSKDCFHNDVQLVHVYTILMWSNLF